MIELLMSWFDRSIAAGRGRAVVPGCGQRFLGWNRPIERMLRIMDQASLPVSCSLGLDPALL
jgi:hypothetical protein